MLPPLTALREILGLPRLSPARLALAGVLLIVAAGLAIAGLIELAHALRLALLTSLHPAWVSVIIALVILLLAGGLCALAYRLSRPKPAPLPPAPAAAPLAEDAKLQGLLWVQRHPHQATLIAAALGLCLGALPEARRALLELLRPPRRDRRDL